MFFVGEYRVTFSGQGRIIIPKKIREALGKGKTFTLTKGFDNCLSGYRNKDWEKAAQELISQSSLEVRKSETKRFLFSSAAIVEIDNQGRFVTPKNLLDYAGLNNKAVIIGVGDHFEVWESIRWDEYIKKVKP
ncbi:division/cell wall cluster transcriptional repressor MraZ [Candidatus Roizmanbacteria bacterium RIFCSPHIGHO2_02_FULL_37_15]|uniref:Transcriptional regulator MraZ n=1 Tax=Candidatus Roizmanbacteria bacterium RIFCSPLOWO2_01_FULL_37_16 TaxID=1802058 RepID=A0A1F7IIT2_9BACT|nr:MAG: division/cell wall cluster transcriptional repressor MraZ [Candidatus Roizmanbacteria bacterium RIFCSPHIGHO2_01_FULL_37_16b]OGK20420.1 MAG: division/cell wall cluster transcriptional repressor MraZ [Candidatus Roizmanbacteria bacterium RIFCSPHIGHO2_02_FULL_37_15]OGK34021.1 MAG: division/cell wall cluster transcriptional repressor MraZ [Candidatus Roizmanbacteria bacterium RIFCSPHIGHO2_12_FULL_36_11]OGK43271.1 MAG: division/cell wall cluster transcriptional repressor MraZ [Candidatus Roiz